MPEDLGVAFGLVFVIEGVLYALAPNAMRRMLLQVLSESENAVRMVGLFSAIFGLLIVWMIRG